MSAYSLSHAMLAVGCGCLLNLSVHASDKRDSTSESDKMEDVLNRNKVAPLPIRFGPPKVRGDQICATELEGHFDDPDFAIDQVANTGKVRTVGKRVSGGILFAYHYIENFEEPLGDFKSCKDLEREFGFPDIAEQYFGKVNAIWVWRFWNGKLGRDCLLKEIKIGFRSGKEAPVFISTRVGRISQ
jgi:hypothetical protein